jgi:hypothetical protein
MAVKPRSPLKLLKSVSHIIQSRLLSASTRLRRTFTSVAIVPS